MAMCLLWQTHPYGPAKAPPLARPSQRSRDPAALAQRAA